MSWRRVRKQHEPAPEPVPMAEPAPSPEPQPTPEPAEFVVRHVSPIDLFRMVGMPTAPPRVPQGPLTQANARTLTEREAQHADQPFEWASHTYMTAHGELRWRCCGNLFTDDHGPYCAMPDGSAL